MRLLATALLALLALPVWAGQDDARLPGLFAKLKATADRTDARAVEQLIWRIWIEHEDEDVNLLMRRGMRHMGEGQATLALAAFDAVVKKAPGFAEGWNKRATVFFLIGDFPGSVADIERTLALEPRHFGALSGLGQIYLALGERKAALRAFEAALAIDPHLGNIREVVDGLRKELAGEPT
jgi:tetratricopeptide (TPR) repeat protein